MLPQKLVWYAPKWSTAPRKWRFFRKHVLSKGPLTRMTLATLLAVALILTAFKIAFPGIVFPNLLPILFALPMVVLGMTLETVALAASMAYVMVNRKKVVISHGQSTTTIRQQWLTKVMLTMHEGERARLRFCYEKTGKRRFKTIGIPNDLDLDILGELLQNDIIARDYRRQPRFKIR